MASVDLDRYIWPKLIKKDKDLRGQVSIHTLLSVGFFKSWLNVTHSMWLGQAEYPAATFFNREAVLSGIRYIKLVHTPPPGSKRLVRYMPRLYSTEGSSTRV